MLYRLFHCFYIMALLCATTPIIAAEKKDHYGIVKIYLQKYNTACFGPRFHGGDVKSYSFLQKSKKYTGLKVFYIISFLKYMFFYI